MSAEREFWRDYEVEALEREVQRISERGAWRKGGNQSHSRHDLEKYLGGPLERFDFNRLRWVVVDQDHERPTGSPVE